MKKSVSSLTSMTIIIASSFALSGCGFLNSSKSLDVEAGPDNTPYTEAIINTVPEGLVGDTENSRQTTERLRSADE